MSIRVVHGECVEQMRAMADRGEQFHSCVTDPPYHLTSIVKRFGKAGSAPAQYGTDGAYARASRGFMGKEWDGGDIAFQPDLWRAVYDVLLPGAHLLAFGGTRTYHRMVCAIEDAGFEIRDQIGWMFGSGFPKSHDVSKGIDKAAGAERVVIERRKVAVGFDAEAEGGGGWKAGEIVVSAPATPEAAQWAGWGTALKPAWEPICVARKPLVGTVAANVLAHGTGALNIEASRIGTTRGVPASHSKTATTIGAVGIGSNRMASELDPNIGRWPANVLHDGSDEVKAAFAAFGDKSSSRANGNPNDPIHGANSSVTSYEWGKVGRRSNDFRDSGTASRFFYAAKADKADRAGSKHPTVKPTDLMRYLVRLVTPPGGTVLDPFAGSGSTGLAADQLGLDAVLIERDAEYVADIRRKITRDAPLLSDSVV